MNAVALIVAIAEIRRAARRKNSTLLIGGTDLPNSAALPNAITIHWAIILSSFGCEMTEGTIPCGDDALV